MHREIFWGDQEEEFLDFAMAMSIAKEDWHSFRLVFCCCCCCSCNSQFCSSWTVKVTVIHNSGLFRHSLPCHGSPLRFLFHPPDDILLWDLTFFLCRDVATAAELMPPSFIYLFKNFNTFNQFCMVFRQQRCILGIFFLTNGKVWKCEVWGAVKEIEITPGPRGQRIFSYTKNLVLTIFF